MIERLLVAAAVAYLIGGIALFPKWTVDDAYITYRYSKNLAERGELVWNAGEDPVEGYTGVMLPVLLAGGIRAGLDPDIASKGIGVASVGAAVWLLWLCLAACGVRGWLRGAAVLLFATAPPMLTHALSGLETMLFCAFVLASVRMLIECLRDDGARRECGLLLVLLGGCLARPEGAALAVSAIAVVTWVRIRERGASGWLMRVALVFIAPAAAYFGWRWWYYGQFMPNTYYAKWHWRTNVGSLVEAAAFAARYLALPLLAPLMLVAVAPRRAIARLRSLPLFAVWTGVVVVVFAGLVLAQYLRSALIMNYSHRFFVPFLGPAILLGAVLVDALLGERLRDGTPAMRFRLAAAAIAAVVLLQVVIDVRQLRGEVATARAAIALLADEHRQVASFLREHLPANERVIVVVDAGAIPYFSEFSTVDFGGLNDEYIGRRWYNAHPEPAIADYFFSHRAGAVVCTSSSPDRVVGPDPVHFFEDPRSEDYVMVARFGSPALQDYWELVYFRRDLIQSETPYRAR